MIPNKPVKEMSSRFTIIINNLNSGKAYTNGEKVKEILSFLPRDD